ncbi:MAG: cytochrome c biogenesis protein CcmE [Gammaproteobacteria bacterium]|nr:MAG: cytochrome c biogenesis protein CcmE [Gammaproteobacteria bacterium]
MTPRRRRMALVLGIVAGVAIAGALALSAFRQNVTFFFDPTQVAAGKVPAGERFRLGGMVTQGSLQRAPGSLEVRFVVTDFSLAKHDENYMPPEVARSLKRRHGESRANATAAPAVPSAPSAPSAPAEAGAPPPRSTPSSAGT